jgi:hypothetical protein
LFMQNNLYVVNQLLYEYCISVKEIGYQNLN